MRKRGNKDALCLEIAPYKFNMVSTNESLAFECSLYLSLVLLSKYRSNSWLCFYYLVASIDHWEEHFFISQIPTQLEGDKGPSRAVVNVFSLLGLPSIRLFECFPFPRVR